jgi:glycerol-3-phosphate dehydrogenase subunit C
MAVGAPVFAGVREGGAELSACDSETCRWWISDVTGRPSVHPVELLRRSYRLPL